MTKTTRAPRQCEIAADEGYNLAGAPVLLARLTAYIGRATFAQLAAIATAAGGEYSKHNTAFQFPADQPAARESFAAQARVILTNTAANHADAAAPTLADRIAARYPGIASHVSIVRPAATPYTDAPTVETPIPARVSMSRAIGSTITDRTPAGYGPSQPSLF